ARVGRVELADLEHEATDESLSADAERTPAAQGRNRDLGAVRRCRRQGAEDGGASPMNERWLRWFQPTRRDPQRDVDDEIQLHLEARVADLVSRGASPDAARRQALTEFGDAEAVRADTLRIDERIIRRDRRADWISEFIRDARIGLRSLIRTPAYTI